MLTSSSATRWGQPVGKVSCSPGVAYSTLAPGTYAYGINDAGQIVGSYGGASGGFLYSAGAYTAIYVPSRTGTIAYGINNGGQVVGSYNVGGGYDQGGGAFLYSDGVYTALNDPLSANFTEAYGINNAGQIVGLYYSSGLHGFLFSGGVYTTLDDPLAGIGGTIATGINDLGQIVGHYYDSDGYAHGFLYSGGVYTTLNDPLAAGTLAYGINDAGQIVGSYGDGFGSHGFFADTSTSPRSLSNSNILVLREPLFRSIRPQPLLTRLTLAPRLNPSLSIHFSRELQIRPFRQWRSRPRCMA